MDENFISNENYAVSPMSDQHSTATISEKVVDVSNIGHGRTQFFYDHFSD